MIPHFGRCSFFRLFELGFALNVPECVGEALFFTVKRHGALNKEVPRSQIKEIIMTSYWL